MAQQAKKRTMGKKAPQYSSNTVALRFGGGLLLVALGGLMFMAVAMNVEGSVFDMMRAFTYAMAGDLAFLLPVIPVWGGVITMLSAQKKTPLRVFVMVSVLYVLVLTAVTLSSQTLGSRGAMPLMDYFLEANVQRYTSPGDYDVFLARGFELGRDHHHGGGLIGMLLAWPLWRLMGSIPGFLVALVLILGDMLLLFRKELTKLIEYIRRRNEEQRRRSEEEQAKLRAREMQWMGGQQPMPGYPAPAQPVQQPMQPYLQQQAMQPAPQQNPYAQPAQQHQTGAQPAWQQHSGSVNVGYAQDGQDNYTRMTPDMIYGQQKNYTAELEEEKNKRRAGRNRKQKQETGTTQEKQRQDEAYRRPEQKPAQEQYAGYAPAADWQLDDMQNGTTASVEQENTPAVAAEPIESVQPAVQQPVQQTAQQVTQASARQPVVRESVAQPVQLESAATQYAAPVQQEQPVPQPAEPKKQTPQSPWQMELERKRAEAAAATQQETPAAPVLDDRPPWEDPEPAVPQYEPPATVKPAAPVRREAARAVQPQVTAPKLQQEPPQGMWQPELHLPPRKEAEAPAEEQQQPDKRPYIKPVIAELLAEPMPFYDAEEGAEDAERSRILEATVAAFKMPAKVEKITHGPRVSRFELRPDPGILVNRYQLLAGNIAMSTKAESVRIESPIPGTDHVGVEIPNKKPKLVTLREILESDEMKKQKSPLAVALGCDVAGKPVVCDIIDLPHLLIAGATKMGKSVCINSLINTVLYRTTPAEVRMILIDPKVVELQCYNGLPNLLLPVVNDPKKASAALEWAVAEMMERYNTLSENGVRNIQEYNDSRRPGEEKMHYILIVIDEMADLMMVCGKEVEASIQRLAQLARAAGIHLILATQRPTVKVITGNIKANIPGRIAFKTASTIDSQTILDSKGAEGLLGNGDMIYKGGKSDIRTQGCFISTQEIEDTVQFICDHNTTEYDPDIIDQLEGAQDMGIPSMTGGETPKGGQIDPLLLKAIEWTVQERQISVSNLQRKLSLGYARAARLVDMMEERGIVTPKDGTKPRACLISHEEFEDMRRTIEQSP